jgi:succinate dehydrogenase / fumarate reductase cytochrome b subunit
MGSSLPAPAGSAFAARLPAALTGLLLVFFLLAHLSGVGIALPAPGLFEAWSTALHHTIWLPAAELALLGVAVIHAISSLSKYLHNRRAGNTARLRSRRPDPLGPLAALAARSQALAGLVLLVFLCVHLVQLRLHRPPDGAELVALQTVLAQPLNLLLYVLAALALALHLFHGGEAAHRSLGLLDPTNAGRIRLTARVLALVLGGGFTVAALGIGWAG